VFARASTPLAMVLLTALASAAALAATSDGGAGSAGTVVRLEGACAARVASAPF
jgi:hypothetical protein